MLTSTNPAGYEDESLGDGRLVARCGVREWNQQGGSTLSYPAPKGQDKVRHHQARSRRSIAEEARIPPAR